MAVRELSPEEVFDSLGKPSFKALEAMVKQAEQAFREASNVLAKNAQYGLVKSYFAVMEWLDQKHMLTEAKAVLGQVQEHIAYAKKTLMPNERVSIQPDRSIRYEVIDSFGNTLGSFDGTDTLSIVQTMQLDIPWLKEIVAGKNDKAIDRFFEQAKIVVERASRLESIQKAAARIAAVIPPNVDISIVKDRADINIGTRSTALEYKSRLKALEQNPIRPIKTKASVKA